jgi:hypothetical protein
VCSTTQSRVNSGKIVITIKKKLSAIKWPLIIFFRKELREKVPSKVLTTSRKKSRVNFCQIYAPVSLTYV